ncbi:MULTISPECIES: CpsD/CapB family tyrosine-protein kinase [Pontibacillus]|uniref:non-specific protein-tyrosine kinase n=1 Tax=Pontibacillus chungwhensis TaxID=265426 RepID=A0ABY8UZK0_9BACI|nr:MULTISPECIES: CpsD/CapB family tyrosine-protein kinase [Pontibacillus]MCD5324118.1 CpsD/CapB family tyrosine-protein kinase [Pontibacillus sp. HN14]WIF97825.1 CpsD/CapB family tyrosine-protein kinase [Pontibacillus chungwhensis]
MARKKNKNFIQKARTLITNSNPKSPISEQYRTIRTNLQFASVDKETRTILVTSAGPGEGKSMTAANVATVFAQQGKKVLLIDADLRKPTIHYTFRVSNLTGLSNYLVGQNKLSDIVFQSEVENLSVMPCGPIPPNPAEILGSNAMTNLIEEAKNNYDMVIFDTPPVLAVTDSQILANACDGVLLVVRSKQTQHEAAQKAKELLINAQAKLLGVVLNGKNIKKSNYYYYYGSS